MLLQVGMRIAAVGKMVEKEKLVHVRIAAFCKIILDAGQADDLSITVAD